MRFIAQLTFIPDPSIPSLVPSERARVQALAAQGTVQALYLAADNTSGWLIMVGSS